MLVPCKPYGSGSVLFALVRLIHTIPTGFLGPAARYCSDESTAWVGAGVGSGIVLVGPGFRVCSVLSSCNVASPGAWDGIKDRPGSAAVQPWTCRRDGE